ncbi:riboflavin synthase subunit alpha, partial [Pasteurella multocida subsp. multocida str. Anand1_buffalo]
DMATMKYILPKGFIAIDGISLTIGEVKGQTFCVNLIPETLNRTLIGTREVGDKVNIEIDPQTQAIVDTVERYLSTK